MTLFQILTGLADRIRTLRGTQQTMDLPAMADALELAQQEVDTQGQLIGSIAQALQGKASFSDGSVAGTLPTGLPQGVPKLTAGVFTVEEDLDSCVIHHNLGEKPDFYFMVASGDFDLAENARNVFSLQFILKPYTYAGTTYQGRGEVNYITTSNTMTSASSSFPYANAETIEVAASGGYYLKGGTTYLWVAGTLEDLN